MTTRTRNYRTEQGLAIALSRGDRDSGGWTVTARSGDVIIAVDCWRDEAGFAGRDWRVAGRELGIAYPGVGRDTLEGRDQFSGLKDVAETAIAVCHRTVELNRLRDEWNAGKAW